MDKFEGKSLEEMQEMLLAAQGAVLAQGGTIADAYEIDLEKLEPLYTLAYNHYIAGNYEDAKPVFQALCLYNHSDPRFWMGFAGACQAMEDYQAAIDAYSMAGIATKFADPTPFIYACICYIKLGKWEEAKNGLEGAVLLGNGDPKYDTIIKKGEVLLESAKAQLEGNA